MLLGTEIHIHTDHCNITCDNLTLQQVLQWCCYLEEFSPIIHYFPGANNVLANCFLRVPQLDSIVGKENDMPLVNEDALFLEDFYSIIDEPKIMDCSPSLPELDKLTNNPLNY